MKTAAVVLFLAIIFFSCSKNATTPTGPTASLPTLTTIAITSITTTSATGGGNISSDGGATVTARGICWSTSPNPVVTENHTTDGSGTGTFTSSMTGLSFNTTYHVRAYATNSEGTAYGNEISFTTLNSTALLATLTITSITSTTAASGGTISSDGGATVTVRGVCWSTTANPVATGNHTTDGSGTGTFTSNITGLALSTTYYVRAYATNSAGTAYGNEISFLTSPAPVIDIDGNSYSTISTCNQTWIAKNLSVTHYRNGDPIPQVSDPILWGSPLTGGAWCYVNNDPATEPIYGRMYNWKAATDPRGLAPAGWHVPSLSDWHKLVKCIDPLADTTILGTQGFVAGGALKETGLAHWLSPNSGASNSTGFTGLPAGIRGSGSPATFAYLGQLGGFWSTTAQGPYSSYYFWLGNNSVSPGTNGFDPSTGMSIRCVKD